MKPFYRILSLSALVFLAACGPTGPKDSMWDARKPANSAPMSAARYENLPRGNDGMLQDTTQPPVTESSVPMKIVKVGLLVPLSGESAQMGQALMDAATLAMMDKYGYTDAGSIKVKVVLVPRDTKGTPQGAKEAAQYVIDSGAEMIVGPLYSQNVKGVADVARGRGVPVLTFSNNPDVAGNGAFVFGFQVDQQVRRVLNYAINRGATRVAMMAPKNTYGETVQEAAHRVLSASHVPFEPVEFYQPSSNAGPEIDKVTAVQQTPNKVDAVLIPEGGEKLTMIVNALKARGMNPPAVHFLGTGLWDEPDLLKGGVLKGGWFASSPPERYAAFDRRFRDYFGYAPPRLSSLAYDAMALASSLAMSSTDVNFSADAITDPAGYNGPVNGIFRCGGNGICERGLAVLEAGDHGVRVVDPAPLAFTE